MRGTSVVSLLGLCSVILLTACAEEGGGDRSTVPPGLPSGIDLARVGTIGDYPPADLCVVVNMDADGRIEVDGAEVPFEQLKALLLTRAGRVRTEDDVRSSLVHAVFRIDRTVPWKVVAWMMQDCAHPEVRMDKVSFAVLPEDGDEEGTLATHLPRDRGISRSGMRPVRPRRSRVRLGRSGGGFAPADLYVKFRARPGAEGASVSLEPEPLVPIGIVLQAVDALHRAGITRVDFQGVPPAGTGEGIREVVADARKRKLDPDVFVDGKPVIVIGGIREMPTVERVRGGFAGTCDRGDKLHEELIPDIKPDVIEQKPIESSEPVIEDPVIKDAVVGDDFKPTQAVDHALVWLRDHQEPKGNWYFDPFLPSADGKRGGSGVDRRSYDPGLAGLAVLAFLNAGETHKHGVFKKTVKRGLQYLKSIQDPEGCFGPRETQHFTYNHAIATLAVAHAYAVTNSPLFKQSAQLGVDFITKCRNPDLAWRYGVRPGDNDTSVSGWMIAALHEAKRAGLRVDEACFSGMRAWLDKVTDPKSGRVGYLVRGTGADPDENRIGEALTAMGVMSRIFLGEDPKESEAIKKGAALVGACPPAWGEDGRSVDMYHWYWGSLAMYSCGGEDWRTWNQALKKVVMGKQRMDDGAFKGSWDPVGPWGREGGRIYSTAMGAICMEVYYRYFKIAGLIRVR